MAVLLLALPTSGLPKDKEPKSYPEKGTVIAIHVNAQSHTAPVYTDPQGQTRGGGSSVHRLQVFRVETETKFYELEGGRKPDMGLGDTIQFRIEKQSAYVQRGDKEKKYRLVGVELKAPKSGT